MLEETSFRRERTGSLALFAAGRSHPVLLFSRTASIQMAGFSQLSSMYS
jgi:hypothetical protein